MEFCQTILEDTNGIYANEQVEISITPESIMLKSLKARHTIPFQNIIGCTHTREPSSKFSQWARNMFYGPDIDVQKWSNEISSASTGFWSIYVCPIRRNSKGDVQSPKLCRFLFKSENDEPASFTCVDYIRKILLPQSNQKILFLVNPFSGTKKAPKIFTEYVLPMLSLAGLDDSFEYIETTKKNHCLEIAKNLNLQNYRSIVTISGDGLFHELINGLMSRDDWEEAAKLPIGVIPGGTSNAIGKNLEVTDTILAIFNIIKANLKRMDLLSVCQKKEILYTHLMVTWGLVADIDIESERFRYIGEQRMIVGAIVRLLKLRSYKGTLYLLPVDAKDQYVLPDRVSHNGPPKIYTNFTSDQYKTWPVQITASFQYFMATNMPWIASDFLASTCTTLDDGEIDILYNTELTLKTATTAMLATDSGGHIKQDGMKHFKVKAFVLEPLGHDQDPNDDFSNLILDVSGERIPYEPIQVEIHEKAITIISPTWLDLSRLKD